MLKHGHTYSGHPTVCAAALANLKLLARRGPPRPGTEIGERLGAGFRSVARRRAREDAAASASGGRDCLNERTTPATCATRCSTGASSSRAIGTDTLAFCPPLVITDEQVDTIVDTLADTYEF